MPIDRSKLGAKRVQLTEPSKEEKSSENPDHDFTYGDTSNVSRSFGLIFGDDGVGKTTFITRFCPDPIALLHFDGRATKALKEARSEGRVIADVGIHVPPHSMSSEALKLAALSAIEKIIKNLAWAVGESHKGNIKTIGIDTALEVDTILNVAFFGNFDNWVSAYNKDKAFVRRQWHRILRLCRESSAHVIFTARQTEIWEDHKATGKFRSEGNKTVRAGVDWEGHLRTKPLMSGHGKKYEIEITKDGVNGIEEGKVYREKEWDLIGGPFAMIGLEVYGGKEEDWK